MLRNSKKKRKTLNQNNHSNNIQTEKYFFAIEQLNEKIKKKFMIETKTKEIEAIVFYQMLIQAQIGKFEIFQERPFEMLFTNYQ